MKTNKFNGIELLEMIKRDEIKENTSINVYHDDVFRTTLVFDGYNLNWKPGEFKIAYLYDDLYVFEIEEPKIGYTFLTPSQMVMGAAPKEKLEEAINLIYDGDFKLYDFEFSKENISKDEIEKIEHLDFGGQLTSMADSILAEKVDEIIDIVNKIKRG